MQLSLIKVMTSICKNAFLYFPVSQTGTSHAFKIDFRCFCSSSQIYEEINLLSSFLDGSSCMKIYLKYFVLHARIILHLHQQDKLLTGGHKNMMRQMQNEHCTEIFLKEQQQLTLEREEKIYWNIGAERELVKLGWATIFVICFICVLSLFLWRL